MTTNEYIESLVKAGHFRKDVEVEIKVDEAIEKNCIGAAASSLAAGLLPGIGSVAATAICVGFIWRMYYQINQALGIRLSKNFLKSIASALLTNLLTGLGGIIVLEAAATVISLIPGIGSVGAAILLAAVDYGLVYVAGLVYVKMLTNLFQAKKDINQMTAEEVSEILNHTFDAGKQEYKVVFEKVREDAKKDIESGKITKNDAFDPEED